MVPWLGFSYGLGLWVSNVVCADGGSAAQCLDVEHGDSLSAQADLNITPQFSVGMRATAGVGAEARIFGVQVFVHAGIYGELNLIIIEAPAHFTMVATPEGRDGEPSLGFKGKGVLKPSFLSGEVGGTVNVQVGWFSWNHKKRFASFGPLVAADAMPLFEADYEFETELLKLMCGIPGICGFDILAKDITNSFGGSLNEAELPDYEGPWYNGSETWNDTPAADAVVRPSASSAGVSSSSAFNDPVRGGTEPKRRTWTVRRSRQRDPKWRF